MKLIGRFPHEGDIAPAFKLVDKDLLYKGLEDYGDSYKILNIFPNINTEVCASSVKKFNQLANQLPNVTILCISTDLPFNQSRFCNTENIHHVTLLSTMRGPDFGHDYGVHIYSGPLEGRTARAVIILNGENRVIYRELVREITHEPNYDAALAALA